MAMPKRLLSLGTILAVVTLSQVALVGFPQSAGATAPKYTWPEFHQGPRLDGVSHDPSISTANASTLGVSWMTNTGALVLSSPVVAWNPTLKETLAYVGNEAGDFGAYNEATGVPVWSTNLGSNVRTTPLVENGSVWIATLRGQRLYKLDASTGAVECSAPLEFTVDSSPVLATPPGGSPTVYIGVNDAGTFNGPLIAVNEANCAVNFRSDPEPGAGTGGVWDGISYAVDAAGEGLIVFGTADPDSAVYAIDAKTGALVWRYATDNPPPGSFDVGAGITISTPGVNGFADGVAYAVNKAGYLAALDLTTGAPIWTVLQGGSISTPALMAKHLIYSQGSTLTSLNAVTGALEWTVPIGGGADGAVAIAGPLGSEVAAVGDNSGRFGVYSAETGATLYTFQTGSYVVSSTAEVDGNFLVASTDGYLYDFKPGGGTAAAPSTAVTSPAEASSVPNPGGSLAVSGTAGATGGPAVGSVNVDIQEGGASGPWWDGATSQWISTPYPNPAIVATPGASNTTWSYSLPVPAAGGSYQVLASAVNTGGVADISAGQSAPTSARSGFTVLPSLSAPSMSLSSGWVAPGSRVSVTASGFQPSEKVALDLAGQLLGTVNTNSAGKFSSASVALPTGTAFGLTDIVATGQTSLKSTSVGLYVTNSWAQADQGATRLSSEANDDVFAHHVSIAPGSYLNEAWTYTTNAALTTPPAVAHAIAYTANQKGVVDAIDVRTGMKVWSTKVLGGGPIDSSPAVDAGSVVVGLDSGSVVELNAQTGAVNWSKSLGTSPISSSPAVAGGVIYIGSTSGGLYALSESSGTVLWQTPLGGAVHSSPAVDASTGVVVVGDDNGNVVGLSTKSGSVLWQFNTGGAVTAAPLLSGGDLYVGSASGHFYALTESSGSSVWSVATAGAVTAGAALENGQLYVGDNKGDLYTITQTTGASTLTSNFASPIVGVAATYLFTVVVMASGNVHGSKGPGEGQWAADIGSAAASAPVILNGCVYVAGEDGILHLWTLPGAPPS